MFKSLGVYSIRHATSRSSTSRMLFMPAIRRQASGVSGFAPIRSPSTCAINKDSLAGELSDDEFILPPSELPESLSIFAEGSVSEPIIQLVNEVNEAYRVIKGRIYTGSNSYHEDILTRTARNFQSCCRSMQSLSVDEITMIAGAAIKVMKCFGRFPVTDFYFEFVGFVLQFLKATSIHIQKDDMAEILWNLIKEMYWTNSQADVPNIILQNFESMLRPLTQEALENPASKPLHLCCAYTMLKEHKDSRILTSICQRFSQKTTDLFDFVSQIELWNFFLTYCSEIEVTTHGTHLRRMQLAANIPELLAPYDISTMPYDTISQTLRWLMVLYHFNQEGTHADRKIIYRLKSNKRTIEQISFELSSRLCAQILERGQQESSLGFDLIIKMVAFTNKITCGYSVTMNSQFIDALANNWDANVDRLSFGDFKEIIDSISSNIVTDNFNRLIQKIYSSYMARIDKIFKVKATNITAKNFNFNVLVKLTKHIYDGVDYSILFGLAKTQLQSVDPIYESALYLTSLNVIQNLWSQFDIDQDILNSIYSCSERLLRGEKPHVYQHFRLVMRMILVNSVISDDPRFRAHHKQAAENSKKLIELLESTQNFNTMQQTLKVYQSNIQIQIGSLFNRLGIEHEPEKFVLFGKVDFFIRPNIILEVLGNCHFYKGQLDNVSKYKKKAYQALGYRTFYCTDSFLKQHDNKLKLIRGIQKALRLAKPASELGENSQQDADPSSTGPIPELIIERN